MNRKRFVHGLCVCFTWTLIFCLRGIFSAYNETTTDWSIMYASAKRKATDIMVDDHIKIGENGLLYRISEIHNISGAIEEFVSFRLYYAGDDTQTTVAILSVRPTEILKVYNQ